LVELMLWALGAIAALAGALWLIGAREPVYAIARRGPAWFVALKRGGSTMLDLAPNVQATWRSRADLAFIGADAPYWTEFMILTGGDSSKSPLTLGPDVADAFIARVDLLRPPALVFGMLKLLIALGILSRPQGAVLTDAQALGFNPAFMPSAASIAALLARPQSYAPAMVNFLEYKPDGGARAYMRYGRVAMRTVYRTGGRLLFYGRVVEIVRAAQAGPAVGLWHDVAAMQYSRPDAILSMEHAPDYRAVLPDRDAGLQRTVVIASTPGVGQ